MSNKSKQVFHKVTAESLPTIKNRYYAGFRELKVGDKICFGFAMNSANIYGNPVTKLDPEKDQISMSMVTFVLEEISGMIYQLYSKD